MKLDEVRQEVVELVAKVHPEMQAGVFNPDTFRSHYLTPFHARDLNSLKKYERQHGTIFCRQCLTRDEKKGLLLVFQLWIEETDNGLDNKPGDWVSLQCQNPDCDFDLVTPRPETPRPEAPNPAYYPRYQPVDPLVATGMANVQSPSITITSNGTSTGQALSSASTLGSTALPPKPSLYQQLIDKYIK